MLNSKGALLFGAGLLAGIVIGWFIKYPPVDSASAAGWAQALGSLVAIFIAVWVPLRERRATEARIAAEKAHRARQLAEQLRSIALAAVSLVHNTLAIAESRWSHGETALDAEQLAELNQRIATASQDEYNKHRITLLDGFRALLKDFAVLTEVQHGSDFELAPEFAFHRDRWINVVNNLNAEAMRALAAVESGASD